MARNMRASQNADFTSPNRSTQLKGNEKSLVEMIQSKDREFETLEKEVVQAV
jgi:hypothetical protein